MSSKRIAQPGDIPLGFPLPKGYIYERKKDPSKRIAPGCEIDSRNILPANATRRRINYYYGETNRSVEKADEYGRIIKNEKSKSVNTLEKLLERAEKLWKANKENIGTKKKTSNRTKKTRVLQQSDSEY